MQTNNILISVTPHTSTSRIMLNQNKQTTQLFIQGHIPFHVSIHVHVVPQAILAALLARELEKDFWRARVLRLRSLLTDHACQ